MYHVCLTLMQPNHLGIATIPYFPLIFKASSLAIIIAGYSTVLFKVHWDLATSQTMYLKSLILVLSTSGLAFSMSKAAEVFLCETSCQNFRN